MTDKQQMIDRLVGVESSKRTYYTELKNTIREMKKKNIQLEIINDVMKSFNINMSMDELLKNVLEKLKHIFPIDRLSLMHLNNNKLEITSIYPRSSTYVKLGTSIPNQNSLYWQVIHERRARNYLIHKEDQYNENHTFLRLNLKQVLIFPLFVKQQVIGLFSLGSEQKINYSKQDINFLQQLSDQIAVSTENVRLYHEVLHVKNEWEKTFSAVVDYMFLVNVNGELIRANKAARDFFHERTENNQTLKDILFEEMSKVELIEECVKTEKTVSCELVLRNKYHYEVFAYPVFDESEKIYSVIIYMKDVTKKRHYEVQILQSGKLAAIGELAAGVAHELNNPLTAILGNSQILLRKAEKSQDTYHLLEDIYECGKRCKNIIQNLLTFSRQDEYMFEKFSVNQSVEKVLSLLGYQFRQQQISLEVYLDRDIPFIEGNSKQIEQVIINLLINARDALDERKENKRIIISSDRNDQFVYLTIEDNGIGIPKELHHEIFHPFFTTKNVTKGTGLGLSVSHGIIESHHGKIHLESEVGKGSKFIIKLPITNENEID